MRESSLDWEAGVRAECTRAALNQWWRCRELFSIHLSGPDVSWTMTQELHWRVQGLADDSVALRLRRLIDSYKLHELLGWDRDPTVLCVAFQFLSAREAEITCFGILRPTIVMDDPATLGGVVKDIVGTDLAGALLVFQREKAVASAIRGGTSTHQGRPTPPFYSQSLGVLGNASHDQVKHVEELYLKHVRYAPARGDPWSIAPDLAEVVQALREACSRAAEPLPLYSAASSRHSQRR